MDNPSDLATAHFAQGFNCAQAVLAAFAPALGLDETTALRIASPLGGGIARRGQVCGAVTGALMALGLARGASTPEGKEKTYRLAGEFLRRFEERHATLLCHDLIGCDMSTPQGLLQARQSGVFQSLCPRFVQSAAEIVREMLDRLDEDDAW